MNKHYRSALALALGLAVTGLAQAQAAPRESVAATAAHATEASRQARLDFLLAPIKTRADLDRYLATTPAGTSPLDLLSPKARHRFLESLYFNENGLVSYDYVELVEELGASDIYRLLSLFGVQRTVRSLGDLQISSESDRLLLVQPQGSILLPPPNDYRGFRCSSPHTCGIDDNSICLTGC